MVNQFVNVDIGIAQRIAEASACRERSKRRLLLSKHATESATVVYEHALCHVRIRHHRGDADLTAVFVAITGVLGAALGEAIIYWLPLRSTLARGALLGMGAHGAGVAKAHQIGREEGSIAGSVMILVGLTNVLAAPLASVILRHCSH